MIYSYPLQGKATECGSIAQLGEHLPYKQRVIGSSPIVPTTNGPVVQLVRTLACHARGQGFESPSGRQNVAERLDVIRLIFLKHASVAQLVEQGTENPRVVGSIPIGGTTKCGFSSFGRARPCQGRGGGFEPRNPLHTAPWPSGKAKVCNTSTPSSILGGASKNLLGRSSGRFLLFHFSLFTFH